MIKQAAIRFALISAAVWILLKYVIFISGKAIELFDFSVMANNFMLLLTVSLAIFFTKKSQGYTEVRKRDDIQVGIKAGMIYTILVVLFSYYYNAKLDSSVLDERIAQRIEQLDSAISTDEGLKLYRERNTQAQTLSKDQIIQKEREATENFLNPRVSALLLVMFFTLLTIFYAAFITIVIRKIYLPGMHSRLK
jgi:amino acid transporter